MLTEFTIRKALGQQSFDKGEAYRQQGMVVAVDIVNPGRVDGKVRDSDGTVYQSQIVYDLGSRRIHGICSCRLGCNCEHVAAVLLHALPALRRKHLGKAPLLSEPGLSDRAVDAWFRDLQAASRISVLETNGDVQPASSPARRMQQLYYVFEKVEFGRFEISLFKGNANQEGTVPPKAKRVPDWQWQNVTDPPPFLTFDDIALLPKLRYLLQVDGVSNSGNSPRGKTLENLFKDVVRTGRAYRSKTKVPPLSWGKRRLAGFEWITDESGRQLIQPQDEQGRKMKLGSLSDVFFYIDEEENSLGLVRFDLPLPLAKLLVTAPAIPPSASAVLAEKLSRLTEHALPKPRVIKVRNRRDLAPRPVLTLYGVDVPGLHRHRELRNLQYALDSIFPCLQLGIVYGDSELVLTPGDGTELEIMTADGLDIVRRRSAKETSFFKELKEALSDYHALTFAAVERMLGYDCKKFEGAHFVFMSDDHEIGWKDERAFRFVVERLPDLREAGWRVEIDSSWPCSLYEGKVDYSAEVESQGNDWFSLSMKVKADDQEFELTPILLNFIRQLPISKSGQLDEKFDLDGHLASETFFKELDSGIRVKIEGEKLKPFVHAFLETHGLLASFHRADSACIADIRSALDGSGIHWRGGQEIVELGKQLRLLEQSPEFPAPESMRGSLRPYQQKGYGWLRALRDNGFGGALADDMGLGKTIQALAMLAHCHLDEHADRPSLLVVPTSLLGNWIREAERFAPGLKVLKLHGFDRKKRFAEIPDHHLILTTYPLVNRDHRSLFSHQYELAILDEAQSVKNPAASVTKQIRKIDARQKLALTGTPMENNLGELWSLYDWLIPGLLGDRKSFNRNWRNPIEKENDAVKQRVLSLRLKPFLLRRTKEEVATELPSKTEINEFVPLPEPQRVLYESIRTIMDERVREAVREKGIDRSRITILDSLLKLRQVCCDPSLVKLEAARKVDGSAKRERLLEMLEELVASGRKILVYSQFVQMLLLIEKDVAAMGWDYAMLHGQTEKRDDEVAKFQNGDVPLFLVSIRAGGVGLNLTAADTVIIFDPWWNPALERQAMDRAHRIGQDKPVFVHRLIAEGSVEASIQEMQKRKQALADALFEGRGEGSMALTEEDISSLLAPIG